MRTVVPFLFALLLSVPVLGAAQPRAARSTFDHAVTYQRCVQTWLHACGMRDAQGRTYGTGRPIQQCTRFRFAPDGRMTVESMPGLVDATGRYWLENGQVRFELFDAEGHVIGTETLRLDADGAQLGDMRRLDPTP